MRKSFTSLLLAASAILAQAAVSNPDVTVRYAGDKPGIVRHGEHFNTIVLPASARQEAKAASRADEGSKVTVNIKDAEEGSCFVVRLLGDKVYTAMVMNGMAEFDNVLPGDYTAFTFFSNKKPNYPSASVVIKKITVYSGEGCMLNMSPDDATKIIKFRSVMPDGKDPVLPTTQKDEQVSDSDLDWTGATAREVGTYTHVYSEKWGILIQSGTNCLYTSASGMNSLDKLDLAISPVDNTWHVCQTRIVEGLDDDIYFAHLAARGTESPAANSPEYTKWDYAFAENPVLKEYGDNGYPYGVLPVPIVNGKADPGMWNYSANQTPAIYLSAPVTADTENFSSNYAVSLQRVEINIEEETSWGFQVDMRGIDSPYVRYDAASQGVVYAVGGAGLYGSPLYWESEGGNPSVIPGAEFYAAPAGNNQMKLGESAPYVVFTLESEIEDDGENVSYYFSPFYNYLGQYTECRGVEDMMTSAFITTGSDKNETSCMLNELDEAIETLAEENRLATPFAIELVNDRNIVIDGLNGKNITTLEYADPSKNTWIPTVTAMQFRNASGDVTNAFDKAADGTLMISGGDMAYDGDDWACGPVTLKVEYAVAGSEDFKEITMEEVPANYLMPGFGTCWQGSLSDVEGMTHLGWYQLRVSMTDTDGNSQTQLIYPAFKVKEFAAVESTAADSDTPAEYFNLQGMRVDAPQPGQVVICRRGTTVSKLLAR